jgi:hypothetical protein
MLIYPEYSAGWFILINHSLGGVSENEKLNVRKGSILKGYDIRNFCPHSG